MGWLIKEGNIYINPNDPSDHRQYLVERLYNTRGALSEILYPSGRRIRYNRDVLDRITSIEQTATGDDYQGDNTVPENFVIMNVQHEGLQRKRITRYNLTSTEFEYDRGARMIEIKHRFRDGLLSHIQYLYDGAGNIRQKAEQSSETNRTSVFYYDSLYRISEISKAETFSSNNLAYIYPSTSHFPDTIPDTQIDMDAFIENNIPKNMAYTYDHVGNRLTRKEGNVSEEHIPDDLDQYLPVNGDIVEYDMNGNLIEDKNCKYRYSFNNQLTSITEKQNGQTVRFFHDPLGRKIMEIRNDQLTSLTYDTWNVVEEYRNNDLKSSIILDEGIDNIIQISVNNANFWIYSDILKSVSYVMEGQEKHSHYEYNEYGGIVSPVQDGILANRFTGKRIIPDFENTVILHLEPMIPSSGRFLQRDPKTYTDGSNLYVYALNNPISRTDPFGTDVRYAMETPGDVWVDQNNQPQYDYEPFWELGPRGEHIPLPGYHGRLSKKYNQPHAINLAEVGKFEEAESAEHYMCPTCHVKTYGIAKGNFSIRNYVQAYQENSKTGALILLSTAGGAYGAAAFPRVAATIGAYSSGVSSVEFFTGETSGAQLLRPPRPLVWKLF